MIEKIIEYCARNRIVVLMIFAIIIGVGVWAAYTTPVDAIPDLSDNQVIVFTDYPGRSPQVVEDQVTYPLAVNLQGLPMVKAVRASSAFGYSMIYVIFDDKADIYWARTRVLERLNYAASLRPAGVTPTLGPDGTGVAPMRQNSAGTCASHPGRLELRDQRRNDRARVADDAEIGVLEDRCVAVLVDRDDASRLLHPDEMLRGAVVLGHEETGRQRREVRRHATPQTLLATRAYVSAVRTRLSISRF